MTARAAYRTLSNPKNKGRNLTLALLLGLIGFAVSSIFSFPVKVYYPMLLAMVYVALIANIYVRNKFSLIKCADESLPIRENSVLNTLSGTVFLLISIITVVAISTISYKWLIGEHYFNLAQGIERTHYRNSSKKSLIKLQTIEKSIISNPYNPKVQFLAGQILIENEYVSEGIEYLERSLTGSPNQSLTLSALFHAYNLKKDSVNKLRIVEKYMDIDPRSVLAYAYATSTYAELGRVEDAKRAYMKMKKNFLYFKDRDRFGPYYLNVGNVALAAGDIEYAKEVFVEAMEKFPKGARSAEYYKKAGGLYYLYSKNEDGKRKGVEMLKQALKLNFMLPGKKEIQRLINKFEKEDVSNF